MRAKSGTMFKVFVVLVVAVAGGWLVWKSTPPFNPGLHEAVAEAGMTTTAGGPKIGNCEILPPDNVWNTPIDKLKKDSKSEAYIGSIGPQAKLHPDFGTNPGVGMPFTEIPSGTRKVRVTFDYVDESDPGLYPIPPDAPVEGGAHSATDKHVLLIDPQRCLLYELFAADILPDGTWHAGSGVKYDLTSNALRTYGWGSADAAGMAILPGLVKYDEVQSGEIKHALRITLQHTQAAFVWPARHKASKITDLDTPPMGTRFRLRADYDISGFSKTNQVILTALKRYGGFVTDNGGSLFFTGVPDKRWSDADLHTLSKITADDFEAVDESSLQMLNDSGRVDPVALASYR